jgi:hypothetical protein
MDHLKVRHTNATSAVDCLIPVNDVAIVELASRQAFLLLYSNRAVEDALGQLPRTFEHLLEENHPKRSRKS